jgi:hypothetical protein
MSRLVSAQEAHAALVAFLLPRQQNQIRQDFVAKDSAPPRAAASGQRTRRLPLPFDSESIVVSSSWTHSKNFRRSRGGNAFTCSRTSFALIVQTIPQTGYSEQTLKPAFLPMTLTCLWPGRICSLQCRQVARIASCLGANQGLLTSRIGSKVPSSNIANSQLRVKSLPVSGRFLYSRVK